jgi:cation diffusion facilitator CzcD-associated flavoprotein CzcO
VSVEVAIVGAGPYGLSLAAHLAARGVEYRAFGQPMSSWDHNMPDGMFLKSAGFASTIDAPEGRCTLASFAREAGLPYDDLALPVPIEMFRAYGHWFRERHVPDVEPDEVAFVDADGDGFSLQLRSGEHLTAKRLVVASGITGFSYVPAGLQSLPPARITHTSEYTRFDELRGRRVAVVGAGQSALETAALLHEAGAHAHIVARAAALSWNPAPDGNGTGPVDSGRRPRWLTPLGESRELWMYWNSMRLFPRAPERRRVHFVKRTLGPSGGWWLRERVEGLVPASVGVSLAGAQVEGDEVVIELVAADERRQLRVDHVIAGTGYRVDVDKLSFLAPALGTRIRRLAAAPGTPDLSGHFESSVRGLYFIGLAAANTFGPGMRFVCGTSFVSPRLARHLVRAHVPARRRVVTTQREGGRGSEASHSGPSAPPSST